MRPLATLIVLFSTFNVFAAPKAQVKSVISIDKNKIERLVNDFYLAKKQHSSALAFLSTGRLPGQNCDPAPTGGTDCLDAACSHMPAYKCDDQSEINQVLTFCRGVDGDCIQSSCARMASYKCDDLSEVEAVANSCRSVFDGKCVDTVCNHMASYKCDDFSEIQAVGAVCSGRVDPSCIDSVCKRLASYQCDDFSELEAVAKSCGGTN